MRLDRLVIAVPVLTAALATGTAYGYGIGIHPTVRDTVYPVCAHNGVHFNKQGHPNCGLHRGWSESGSAAVPGSTAGSGPVTEPGRPGTRPPDPTRPAHPGRTHHPTRAGHPNNSHHATAHGRGKSGSRGSHTHG
ncbi:MAG TPA: hypothetical protein VMU66_06095 [Gaiellales bacterium]|nr:hypothetical protein [Gaiellales bacterium]